MFLLSASDAECSRRRLEAAMRLAAGGHLTVCLLALLIGAASAQRERLPSHHGPAEKLPRVMQREADVK